MLCNLLSSNCWRQTFEKVKLIVWQVHLLLSAWGNMESSLSLNLAFEPYLINAKLLPILFLTFSLFLVSSFLVMSFLLGQVLCLIFSFWDSLILSLFSPVSVLLVLPFETNELDPKSNLTVGMWTNSGRRVVLGLIVLLVWIVCKSCLVSVAGFLLFKGDSVVVWGTTGLVALWLSWTELLSSSGPFPSNK